MIQQYLHPAQQEIMFVGAKDTVAVCGRAFGKAILQAMTLRRNFERMPGCSVGIVGQNAKRLLTNIIPSWLQYFESWGFSRNVHWAIGIHPPKDWGWAKPVIEPISWENVISFYNGSVAIIISQDRVGTSNSLSLDFLHLDEAKFINFERLKDETFPANRGNAMHFGSHYFHHGMLITSDMPVTKKGSWFLKYKDACNPDDIALIKGIIYEIWRLRQKQRDAIASGSVAPAYINDRIRGYMLTLSQLRSRTLYYHEYSSIENLAILGEDYIRQMKRDLPPLTFRTSILCMPIGIAQDGFYAALSDDNLYTASNLSYIDNQQYDFDKLKIDDCRLDADLDDSSPLVISFDANANINWLVVCQRNDAHEIHVVKSFYVKYERKLQELLDDFMAYYAPFKNHSVIFYYDATFVSNNYALHGEDFHTFITHYLIDHLWAVNEFFLGKPMAHVDKCLLINRMFRGKANNRIYINQTNNPDLLLSIESAGIYNGKKDKTGEKLAETEEDRLEGRTDGSDAFDTAVIGIEKYPQSIDRMTIGISIY
jgi:hypothetical protein